ncbi:MAG TPA: CorA family divalent cation transporter [Candidatus Sulfotelmatobacter sp.]|nr:CorA family divalent cation transporter [Candidatus Sulfotelmatobacter sp.]
MTPTGGRTAKAILYDASGHDSEVRLEDAPIGRLAKDQLLWVDTPSTNAAALPKTMTQALAGSAPEGQLELFDDFFRFTIKLLDQPGSHLHFAVGPSWLLTSGDIRPAIFDQFIEADQGETLKGKMSATALMSSLLLRYLDGFREEIAKVDVSVDKLDETILRGREKRSPLNTLAALRRRLADLRAILIEQRGVIKGLIAPDFVAHVEETDRDFLVEVNRVFEKLEDDIGRARDTVIGSFELYATRVAQDTNHLVKVLTIATVITGVIGAVAGVFGMNFNTPIANTGLAGFLMVTGGMILVSVGIVAFAIWRRWL